VYDTNGRSLPADDARLGPWREETFSGTLGLFGAVKNDELGRDEARSASAGSIDAPRVVKFLQTADFAALSSGTDDTVPCELRRPTNGHRALRQNRTRSGERDTAPAPDVGAPAIIKGTCRRKRRGIRAAHDPARPEDRKHLRNARRRQNKRRESRAARAEAPHALSRSRQGRAQPIETNGTAKNNPAVGGTEEERVSPQRSVRSAARRIDEPRSAPWPAGGSPGEGRVAAPLPGQDQPDHRPQPEQLRSRRRRRKGRKKVKEKREEGETKRTKKGPRTKRTRGRVESKGEDRRIAIRSVSRRITSNDHDGGDTRPPEQVGGEEARKREGEQAEKDESREGRRKKKGRARQVRDAQREKPITRETERRNDQRRTDPSRTDHPTTSTARLGATEVDEGTAP